MGKAPHRERVEEWLELCWTAAEDGLAALDRDAPPRALLCIAPDHLEVSAAQDHEALEAMIRDGLLRAEGRRIQLSDAGREAARPIVRRHRLAEVLLHQVLDVSEASMESTACQVEHILNPEVTEAVCAFLGHPPACPHGRAIPRDRCCEDARRTVDPLLVPLRRLAMGEDAVVAFVHTKRHAYLQRLAAFGVTPGALIRLRQTRPALVVRIGETELALDPRAGDEVLVRRRPSRMRHAECGMRNSGT